MSRTLMNEVIATLRAERRERIEAVYRKLKTELDAQRQRARGRLDRHRIAALLDDTRSSAHFTIIDPVPETMSIVLFLTTEEVPERYVREADIESLPP
jgi:hypothetical protein